MDQFASPEDAVAAFLTNEPWENSMAIRGVVSGEVEPGPVGERTCPDRFPDCLCQRCLDVEKSLRRGRADPDP